MWGLLGDMNNFMGQSALLEKKKDAIKQTF